MQRVGSLVCSTMHKQINRANVALTNGGAAIHCPTNLLKHTCKICSGVRRATRRRFEPLTLDSSRWLRSVKILDILFENVTIISSESDEVIGCSIPGKQSACKVSVLVRLPLCARAIGMGKGVENGWACVFEFEPAVGYRQCPMPMKPDKSNRVPCCD